MTADAAHVVSGLIEKKNTKENLLAQGSSSNSAESLHHVIAPVSRSALAMECQFISLFIASCVSICSARKRNAFASAEDMPFFRNNTWEGRIFPSGRLSHIAASFLQSTELTAMTISDIEQVALVKLEPQARMYYSTGAEKGQTVKENTAAFQRLRFRPRYLVDVSNLKLSTTVLGHRISFPVGFSPSAMQKMAHPIGEVGTARAAQDAETVMILSSMSTTSLEDVRRQAPNALLWQQTYMFKNRNITEWLVKRAAKAGYSAIVLTADSPVAGRKLEPTKHRFVLPRNVTFPNFIGAPEKVSPDVLTGALDVVDDFISQSASWKDIAWLREISGLPVVVKGILTSEAAIQAANHGAAAVLVSNHGGRQLDGTPATIEVLPEIVSAVGRRLEVYLDSGVRSGSDVAKALSLGARAVFVGRPAPWGLSYDGKKGVDKVLEIFRNELERTMKLLGCPNVRHLNPMFVAHQNHYAKTNWNLFRRGEL